MQYWLEKAEITLRECRFGGYKLSDWYTRCLEAKLSDACVGLNDYTHAKLYHTVQEYYSWEKTSLLS